MVTRPFLFIFHVYVFQRQIFAESDKKQFKNKELGAKISGSGNAGFSGWSNIVCILWHGVRGCGAVFWWQNPSGHVPAHKSCTHTSWPQSWMVLWSWNHVSFPRVQNRKWPVWMKMLFQSQEEKEVRGGKRKRGAGERRGRGGKSRQKRDERGEAMSKHTGGLVGRRREEVHRRLQALSLCL